jgi:hypothetical protein
MAFCFEVMAGINACFPFVKSLYSNIRSTAVLAREYISISARAKEIRISSVEIQLSYFIHLHIKREIFILEIKCNETLFYDKTINIRYQYKIP